MNKIEKGTFCCLTEGGVGDGGWNSRGEGVGKIAKTFLAGGVNGGLDNDAKFKRLLIFEYDFFDFHLYKMSIYLKTLCWKKVLPKLNSYEG